MTAGWPLASCLLITVSVIALLWLWNEYAPWSAGARYTGAFAKTANVQRRKWEPLRKWDARVLAAMDELHDAGDEFMAAVHRGEGEMRQISARGWIASLPEDHPAAIRYARAKGLHH